MIQWAMGLLAARRGSLGAPDETPSLGLPNHASWHVEEMTADAPATWIAQRLTDLEAAGLAVIPLALGDRLLLRGRSYGSVLIPAPQTEV